MHLTKIIVFGSDVGNAAQKLPLMNLWKKLKRHGTGGLNMSKAVLISIRPEWVKKILSGKKTLEVRKNRPCLETPFKCYIYCTLNGLKHPFGIAYGRVVGEFVCDRVETIKAATEPYGIYDVDDYFVAQTRLVDGALWDYGKGATLYGWHISNLKIYDDPKPLSEFTGLRTKRDSMELYMLERPPQSWCYVEELK